MEVILDVDDVVAATRPEWYRRYNRDYNDNLTEDRVLDWAVHKFVKPECGMKLYDYLGDDDLYECVKPLPGAVEGVRRIRELGHDILFATSCTYGMVDPKARWMEYYGLCEKQSGGKLPKDFVPIEDKHRLSGDLLVDDRADTIKRWVVGTRRRAILVEYPNNASLDLHSMDWQRCLRAPAYPDLATAWPAIIRHIERMS